MKKVLIVLLCMLLIVLSGCSYANKLTDEELDDGKEPFLEVIFPDTRTLEEVELAYLESNIFEDLKNLCSKLSDLSYTKRNVKYQGMVLKYYPKMFEAYEGLREKGIFIDACYADYVTAHLVAEGFDEFVEQYIECKGKAESQYQLLRYLIQETSNYNTCSDFTYYGEEEYEFLYLETLALYEQSKQDDVKHEDRQYSIYSIALICEDMGKDEEREIYLEEFGEYLKERDN